MHKKQLKTWYKTSSRWGLGFSYFIPYPGSISLKWILVLEASEGVLVQPLSISPVLWAPIVSTLTLLAGLVKVFFFLIVKYLLDDLLSNAWKTFWNCFAEWTDGSHALIELLLIPFRSVMVLLVNREQNAAFTIKLFDSNRAYSSSNSRHNPSCFLAFASSTVALCPTFWIFHIYLLYSHIPWINVATHFSVSTSCCLPPALSDQYALPHSTLILPRKTCSQRMLCVCLLNVCTSMMWSGITAPRNGASGSLALLIWGASHAVLPCLRDWTSGSGVYLLMWCIFADVLMNLENAAFFSFFVISEPPASKWDNVSSCVW